MDKYKVLINKFGGLRWWLNCICHREGGPAIIMLNSYKAWFVRGALLTKEQHHGRVSNG